MLLTDRRLLPPGMPLAQAVSPAVTGGVSLVVLRETDLPMTPRTTLAGFVRDGVRGRAPFLIGDDAKLARETGADGVHIDQPGGNVEDERSSIGPNRALGVRVTSLEECEAAGGGADYLLVELDWAKPVRALETLSAFASRASVPLIAGTDMPVDQVGHAIRAGAAGIAICRPAMEAYDRAAACRTYREALDSLRLPSQS
jgi:thiamine-phosphate diphosphorylase